MGTRVICNLEMVYNGEQRFKGEVFDLIGARNDDALVKVKHVTPYTGEESALIKDDSGRVFTNERARQQYRITTEDSYTVIRRPVGRPAGRKDSAPRKAPAAKAPRTAPRATA